MDDQLKQLIDQLIEHRSLSIDAYEQLISCRTSELVLYAAEKAVEERRRVYGTDVFIRGLIEISNHCKNDCYYCGLRCSNTQLDRYRMTNEQIMECVESGYELGFRTFVLQGGEDAFYTDDVLCSIVGNIKNAHSDCAVTLSIGERSRESYQRLFDAGADRYLLRHETASSSHYAQLHPSSMSFDNRMHCISDLREIGYTVGIGFMVGSPGQTPHELAQDLKLIEEFKPDMCGIGPFVPHHATPFANDERGSVELTCFLLSLMRLIQPNLLIPATTSLSTLDLQGREKGMLSGANVVMPNLSPETLRPLYELYDNKAYLGAESAQALDSLDSSMESIGYKVVIDRGDPRN